MQDNKINTTTAEVIGRIIGEAAFMFIDPIDAKDRPVSEEWKVQGVRLSFNGDVSGEFRFWAPVSLSREIAVNMLGVDQSEPLPDEKLQDALKEIVNIIVGNFLTDMYGDGVAATLGLPCMIDPAKLPIDRGNPDALWLSMEGEAILCIMRIADDINACEDSQEAVQ
jgi:chemotaxis protein CheY-P-specific phosphatase CheC